MNSLLNIYDVYKRYISKFWKLNIGLLVIVIGTSGLGLLIPVIFSKIIDDGIIKKDMHYIIVMLILYSSLFVIKGILTIFQEYLLTRFRNETDYDLSLDLINRFFHKDMQFLLRMGNGEIVQRILSEIDHVKILYTDYFISMIIQVFIFIFSSVVIFSLQPQLLYIVLILIPITILIHYKSHKKIKILNKNISQDSSRLANTLNKFVIGILAIKVYRLFGYALEEISKKYFIVANDSFLLTKFTSIYNQLINITFFLPYIFLVLFGGKAVLSDQLSIGGFILINTYLAKIFNPIITLAKTEGSIQRSIVSIERYLEIDKHNHIENLHQLNSIDKINFDDVCFSYNTTKCVIKNFSVDFLKGSLYVLLGKNGTGKTTLLNLLFGLINPTSGNIKFDDMCIESINKDIYGDLFVYASQSNVLFSDLSIMQNVILNRDITEQRVIDTAREIGIFNDFFELEEGLGTLIIGNGDNLSGGQRQKISILRALISKPNVLVLDEPTAHLDHKSINLLMKFISQNKHDKIIIIATHDVIIQSYADVTISLDA